MNNFIQSLIMPGIIVIFSFSIYWYIKKISGLASSRKRTEKYFMLNSPVEVAAALAKASSDVNLGKCWSILKGNWAPGEGEKHITFVHLKSLFDSDTLSGDDTYRRMMMSLPGIFVGMGILGTFIGINDGLSGFDSTNTDAINNSIEVLIGGMETAFNTSIVGIFTSIFFMVALYGIRKIFVVRNVGKFYSFLESKFEYHSTSRFLSDIREQSIAQTNAIKKLKEELVEPLEEALEGAFNRTIVPVIQQMSETVTGLSDFSTGSSTVALEGLVDSFLEKLTSASNLQLESINEQLKVTTESITAAREGMDVITEKQLYASNLQSESSQILGNTTSALGELVNKVESIRSVADRTAELVTSLSEASITHDKAILEFSTRGEKIAENMEAVYSQTNRLWNSHNQSFEKLSDAVEIGVPKFAEEVNKGLGSVLNRFDAELTRAVRSLEGLLEDMQTSFEGMVEKMDEKKVEPSMAVSVNRFNESVLRISKDLKALRSPIGDLNE